KIKTLDTPNDYAMLKEVFKRRFSKKTSGWKKPDLIIVDGGKGQLKQIQTVFKELGISNIDFIAIAKGQGEGARARGEWLTKKQEEIYLPDRANPVILKPGTKELNLLQHIRDEAHRFAITYHRRLREKALSHSFLDDIPGIGEKRKKELIKYFGSPEKVVNASIEKLKEIKGLTPEIIKHLKSLQNIK
ncbi:excinuclease ABC subunit C, partial [bacterium]|nr:excinuclease ABC subunit C [bacterium]